MRKLLAFSLFSLAVVTAASIYTAPVLARQLPSAPVYAIRGAKIVTAGAAATIDKGNVVLRNGVIADVGANAPIPDDAVVIDGTGMTVYPGLIDMASSAALAAPADDNSAGAAGRGGRGGGRGANASGIDTWAEADRVKREAQLNPDYEAARHIDADAPALQRMATAGITSVLAVPSQGLVRGQSALINTMAPPDLDDVSAVARDRRGAVVVKAPVAQHVTFGGRVGGPGYPAAPLGTIAFVRQAFSDAMWQQDARAWSAKHPDQPRPTVEPALDALAPALAREMPVMFDGNEFREILRALSMAKEFNLNPIVLGGLEAGAAAADLKAAKASVVFTFPASGGNGRGGGRGGNTPARVTRMQQDAAKQPAQLDAAGVPFAFSSQGLANPADFLRNVSRAVRDGGLAADRALRALTSDAARMAGVPDRLGSIEKGKIANLVMTDGDLFADGTRVRRVFVDGRPTEVR
jgi:imidazolonepropionase-like amidohydrolase